MKLFKFFKREEKGSNKIYTDVIEQFVKIASVEVSDKLQELFNQPIVLENISKVAISISELPLLIGDVEDTAISVIFNIENELKGKIAFLISKKSALSLYNLLTQKNIESIEDSPGNLNNDVSSCIESVASIFSMSFVSAISNLIQKPIFTSIPVISYSFRDSVINEIIFEQINSENTLEIFISKFMIEGIDGFFLYIPEVK
ncbi:MAG: hypothetical protein WH035_00540 [Spirochaetota bacterium]